MLTCFSFTLYRHVETFTKELRDRVKTTCLIQLRDPVSPHLAARMNISSEIPKGVTSLYAIQAEPGILIALLGVVVRHTLVEQDYQISAGMLVKQCKGSYLH